MLADVDNDLLLQGTPTNTWSEGYPTFDLEYADDTLLLALTTPQMQDILTSLESVAHEYGMHLNKTKTELLINPDRPSSPLYFTDGAAVPTTPQIKYLGTRITWKKPFDAAFLHRAAIAEEAFKKLRLVWNSSLSQAVRLRIFQSTFTPTLIYALDTLTLTQKQLDRVDAFFIRFLRRVVRVKASYTPASQTRKLCAKQDIQPYHPHTSSTPSIKPLNKYLWPPERNQHIVWFLQLPLRTVF